MANTKLYFLQKKNNRPSFVPSDAVVVETQTNANCTPTSQPAVPPDDLKIRAPASFVE